jgi:hypothetical protein
MPIDPAVLVALALVVIGSAAVQGFTGFGFGLVGMAFCVPLLGPRDANVLWTVLALLLVGSMWYQLRRQTRWPLVLSLLVGALAGLPMGIWVLANGGEQFLSRFMGAAIVVFAAYSLVNPHFKARSISPLWGLPAGVVSGFFSGVTSMGGPAAVIFLLVSGLDKDEMKGNLAAYFTLSVCLKLVMLGGGSALLRVEHVTWSAVLAVPLVLGMALGMFGARFVSTRAMRRIVCAFLFLPGVLLLTG